MTTTIDDTQANGVQAQIGITKGVIASLRAELQQRIERLQNALAQDTLDEAAMIRDVTRNKAAVEDLKQRIEVEEARIVGLQRRIEMAKARKPELEAALPGLLSAETEAARAKEETQKACIRLEAELSEAYVAAQKADFAHSQEYRRYWGARAELDELKTNHPELFTGKSRG